MKTKPKSEFIELIDFIGKTFCVLVCLLWISISNSKLVNYFKARDKITEKQGSVLNLKEIQIPELGQKYLRSCR